MIIKSDNKALAKELTALEKILTENDAWFHSGLTAVCENGSLSLSIQEPVNPGTTVLKVPEHLLVPANELGVSVKKGSFEIDPDTDKMTPLQIDIGKRMIEFFNLTNKPDLHKKECAWILFHDHPDLLDMLVAARTANPHVQEKQSYLHSLPDARDDDDFLAWSFLQTRVLGQKDAQTKKKRQVIMPVIDFLNHDHRGSPFLFMPNKKSGKKAMQVNCQQPFFDSYECYVMYGFYDALDTFLSYGFPDVSVPYVRSIPLDVAIGDYGTLKVKSLAGLRHEKELPKEIDDIRRFMPIPARQPDGSLELSHLIIPVHAAPHALRRVLQVAIRSMVGKDATRKFVIDNVYMVEEKIVKANVAFYDTLLKKLEDSAAPDPLKAIIRNVADLQLKKLGRYMFNPDFFYVKEDGEKNESVIKVENTKVEAAAE